MKDKVRELILRYSGEEGYSIKQVVKDIDDLYNGPKLSLKDRQTEFVTELSGYLQVYDKAMLNKFYKYWGVPKSGKARLMPFEKEKSWNLKARLKTWSENDKKFSIVNLLKKS